MSSFETLDEALEANCQSLIPTAFTMCDDNGEEMVVTTGSSDDEVNEPGHSATQRPKSYNFNVDDYMLRIIDTPGIGDSRGIEKDKENLEAILHGISNYDEIHGICILLKPNCARLTPSFRFCILQLLTHLHKSACHNIVFCFTNSRGSFYKPGDTMPTLRRLLRDTGIEDDIPLAKPTMYFFDSEAFRFIAASCNPGHPVKFSKEDTEDFRGSWNKSKSETTRLLEHIESLEPHKVRNTISVNSARQRIEQLSEPLATLSQLILIRKDVIKDEVQNIKWNKLSIKDLEDKKFVERNGVEIDQLDHPQTVCGHENCMRIIDGAATYPQICHQNCGLTGTPANTIGHHNLMSCLALRESKGLKCFHCGHSYQDHLHIYYKARIVKKKILDESIVSALKGKMSVEETKKRIIKNKEDEIAELEKEIEEIQDASAHFACFLKTYAITPYNDALLDYLDHLISVEKQKEQAGGSNSVRNGLEKLKQRYQEQIDLLLTEMSRVDSSVQVMTTEQVGEKVKSLCNLKHAGQYFKKMMQTTKSCRSHMEEIPVPPSQAKKNKSHEKKTFLPKFLRKWF